MIDLVCLGKAFDLQKEIVAKVIGIEDSRDVICKSLNGDSVILQSNTLINPDSTNQKVVVGQKFLDQLYVGDVLLLKPNGFVRILFRVKSNHNSLFVTEMCNSNCLMCSQPPKNADDIDYHYNTNEQLIRLIPESTKFLGVTGGEPLLLESKFVKLLKDCQDLLPETHIHVLTNGRYFAWPKFVELFNEIDKERIVFGIPLYSDFDENHDFIVQAKNAFNQTILGLHNLGKNEFRIEIRCVLHKLTFERLPRLAEYIYYNLPFVEHIAFMGLEYTGYTPYNSKLLWVEPHEYSIELEQAVLFLDSVGINVSIYNIPLCLLTPGTRKFAQKSISDWKKEYMEECRGCALLNDCGGVFGTSKVQSAYIKAIID